jgi:hypothetical protein
MVILKNRIELKANQSSRILPVEVVRKTNCCHFRNI